MQDRETNKTRVRNERAHVCYLRCTSRLPTHASPFDYDISSPVGSLPNSSGMSSSIICNREGHYGVYDDIVKVPYSSDG
jgi:hypothetical protein